ncbi:MAG: response regulator [Myxococcota bacterium]
MSSVLPTLLLVDDEPRELSALQRTVAHMEATVRAAASAEEAKRLIRQERPDVVLADYFMEPVDGLDLLLWVQREHPGVTCVLHTGRTDLRTRYGADIPVLGKPCAPEVLRDLLTQLFAQRSARPQRR